MDRSKGTFLPVNVDQDNIVRNDNSQGNPDIAEVEDVIVTVWDELTSAGSRSVKYSVYTKDSDTYYVNDLEVDSDGRYPRVGVIESAFVIVYQSIANTNQLKTKVINAGDPTTLLDGAIITTTVRSRRRI